jgi:hypothetical protein
MQLYDVSYFDRVEWSSIRFQVIAENETQVRELVDARRSADCRGKPYNGREYEDSLTITDRGAVAVPFVLTEIGDSD